MIFLCLLVLISPFLLIFVPLFIKVQAEDKLYDFGRKLHVNIKPFTNKEHGTPGLKTKILPSINTFVLIQVLIHLPLNLATLSH